MPHILLLFPKSIQGKGSSPVQFLSCGISYPITFNKINNAKANLTHITFQEINTSSITLISIPINCINLETISSYHGKIYHYFPYISSCYDNSQMLLWLHIDFFLFQRSIHMIVSDRDNFQGHNVIRY